MPERWHVCRKILRGHRSEGGTPPFQLPESQREESVRVLNAHSLSEKTQENIPHNGQHPVWCSFRSPGGELGVAQHWGERALPNIRKKPSYLSPFIFHLYNHYDCITSEEEDMLTIAAEEVTYKVRPMVAESSTSSDPIIADAPPSSPGSPPSRRAPASPPSFRKAASPPPPSPPQQCPHPEVGPNRDSA